MKRFLAAIAAMACATAHAQQPLTDTERAQFCAPDSAVSVDDPSLRRAREAQVAGAVVLDCAVGRNGRLRRCAILSETPPGYGLGEAALRRARSFRMGAQTQDGRPTQGGSIRMCLRYDYAPPPPTS